MNVATTVSMTGVEMMIESNSDRFSGGTSGFRLFVVSMATSIGSKKEMFQDDCMDPPRPGVRCSEPLGYGLCTARRLVNYFYPASFPPVNHHAFQNDFPKHRLPGIR